MTIQQDGWQFHVALVHLYRDAMRIVEQRTGMSQTRMEIMHELFHVEEMSQAELQQRLGVEGAVITRIVKQLESAGLVTRRADPQDNRFTLVALSAEARHYGVDSADFKDVYGEQILKGFSDEERAQLLAMMRRIEENVRLMENSALGKIVK